VRTGNVPDWKTVPLIPNPATVLTSPDPASVRVANPSVLALASGRIVVAADLSGPGVKHLPGAKGRLAHLNHWLQGRILVSSDKGEHWSQRQDYPFRDALLFRSGANVYLLGNQGALCILRSPDGGETWGHPVQLTDIGSGPGDRFISPVAGLASASGMLQGLAMAQVDDPRRRGSPAAAISPVVVRAREGADLSDRRSWTFHETNFLPESFFASAGDGFGVPFYAHADIRHGINLGGGRWADPPGWRHAHVLRITDPNHLWHDPKGQALHAVIAAEGLRSHTAMLLRMSDGPDGKPVFEPEHAPSGRAFLFLPIPGGHLPFSLLTDETSGLFWLLSHQTRGSLTRPDRLPATAREAPGVERSRLQLSVSSNLLDWWTVGYVAGSDDPAELRYECAMAVRGADLCVVWTAGMPAGKPPRGGTRIEFGLIPAFRELLY